MWKTLNSPFVILVIVIIAVFAFKATTKPKLADEIRGAYKELNAVIQDSATDAEKSKAVRAFAQEMATQIREGFAAGLESSKKDDEYKAYIDTRDKIKISDIRFVKSKWPGREKIVFTVSNDSDKYISNLKLNYQFYKQGELIDSENRWVSEIKILGPGEKIAVGRDRQLPEEDTDEYRSDGVKIIGTSFDIRQIE